MPELGLNCELAESGEEALAMYANDPGKYSLILMDIHMPQMDGYEATQAIRALSVQRDERVPVIAMTANVFRDDVERCVDAGMDDYICKPIDTNDLLQKMEMYLHAGHAGAEWRMRPANAV